MATVGMNYKHICYRRAENKLRLICLKHQLETEHITNTTLHEYIKNEIRMLEKTISQQDERIKYIEDNYIEIHRKETEEEYENL